jgi:uncharacterized protein YkwD
MIAFTGVLIFVMAAVGIVTEAAPAGASQAAGARVTARWSGAINAHNRAAVNQAYWSRYASKLSQPIDWRGGSISSCLPGHTSALSANATLSALNFVRSMAGLAPVRFSATLSARAQRAALMMDANDRLDHDPPSGWRCYTRTGADTASKSNLALAWPSLNAGQIVDLYMDDPGSDNAAVGHRRWVLNPFSTVMGSGSTTTANALVVIGPTRSSRPNPRYVPWPTAGYFPNAMEPNGRWSLSAGIRGTDFSRARLRVFQNGVRIPAHKYRVHKGYAQPTLVWQMPQSISQTGVFKVVVRNIHRRGTSTRFHTRYTVRLFTPYR